jgi:DNA polymerase-2
MFGVLANPNCRFYSRDIANAITHFGQFLIKLTAEKMIEFGHEVIYGDTDSIFVKVQGMKYEQSDEKGKEFEDYINKFYDAYVKKNYNRKNAMVLEFEKVYKKFFMPMIRGTKTGAKKRYAGIIEKDGKDELDFVGLEFVRSDWTKVAKEFQKQILEMVFNEQPIEDFVSDFVEKLKRGEFDDKLVYRKWIRKPVSEYVKTTPPHIQAARKIGKKGVGLIDYYITVDGPEEKDHLKHKIDYDHYIDKQIKPIADSVLVFFDKKFDELKGGKQKSLFDY